MARRPPEARPSRAYVSCRSGSRTVAAAVAAAPAVTVTVTCTGSSQSVTAGGASAPVASWNRWVPSDATTRIRSAAGSTGAFGGAGAGCGGGCGTTSRTVPVPTIPDTCGTSPVWMPTSPLRTWMTSTLTLPAAPGQRARKKASAGGVDGIGTGTDATPLPAAGGA
jgi:hypothetical protein